jgi:hypothetical protein
MKEIPVVLRRARLEKSVNERKEAQSSQDEFDNTRLKEIDKCFDDISLFPEKITELKREIFILIFSPPAIGNTDLAEDVRNHHHIISDSINLDLGIWKLVNSGQWDVLKKLHKSTLEEFCPGKFSSRLSMLLWLS